MKKISGKIFGILSVLFVVTGVIVEFNADFKGQEAYIKSSMTSIITSTTSKTSEASVKETSKTTTKAKILTTTKAIAETTTTTTTKETTKATTKETTKETTAKPTEKITTQTTKPIEAIIKDVLNGKYGNGEERYQKLKSEGYDYDKIQAEINKQIKPKITNNQSRTITNLANPIDQMPVNSLLINGVILNIVETDSQSVLDSLGQTIANWNGNNAGPKYVGGGSRYFALHDKPYGWLVYNAREVTLKDLNGNVKTYYLREVSGVRANDKRWDPTQLEIVTGEAGDIITIQTCIDKAYNYRYWTFS